MAEIEIMVSDLANLTYAAIENCRKSLKFGYQEEVLEKGCWWKLKKAKIRKHPLSEEEFAQVIACMEPFKSVIGVFVLNDSSKYSTKFVRVSVETLSSLHLYAGD